MVSKEKTSIYVILSVIFVFIPVFLILLLILISRLKLIDNFYTYNTFAGWFFIIASLSPPLAILFGKIAIKNINDNPELKGKKLAHGAINTGLVMFFIFLLIILSSFVNLDVY